MSLLLTDESPFEGPVDRLLEPVRPPSPFYKPAYTQGIISFLVEDLQAAVEVSKMVHLVNKAFIALEV